MKTIIILNILLMLTLPLNSFSQKSLVKKASKNASAGNLQLAIGQIMTATDLSKKQKGKYINSPNTWIVKGDICHAVFSKGDSTIKNPLNAAFDSYQKAYYYDKGNKNLPTIKIKLLSLSKDYIDQAKKQFDSGLYSKSLDSFEQILKIESLDYMKKVPNAEDSVVSYNAGLAAFKAQNWDKAILYFSKTANFGYNGIKSYQLLAESYRQKKDIIGYDNTVNACIKRYPDSKNLFGR
jgi:tetratricopeptide (TPR) repeat protein